MLRPANRVIDRHGALRPIRFLEDLLIKGRLLFTLRDNNECAVVRISTVGYEGTVQSMRWSAACREGEKRARVMV